MGEYYNKEYYNKIKGNCAYIDLSPDNIKLVMRALYDNGIPFSASYGGYRNTITVHNDDKQRALEIANANRGVNKSNQRVIGNTEYKSIKDRHYINTSAEIAMQVSAILSGDSSIKFSGVIKGNGATITVSGAKNAEMVNRIIENVRNADILNELAQAGFERMPDSNNFVVIRNVSTGETAGFKNMAMVRNMWNDRSNEFFHAPVYAVDKAAENAEPFYISDTDGFEEIGVYVDENGTAPTFPTEEAAEKYADNNDIPLAKADDPMEHREEAANAEKNNTVENCYAQLRKAVFENETLRNAVENSDMENAHAEALSVMEKEAMRIFNADVYGNIDFYADFFGGSMSERRMALEEYISENIRRSIEARDNSVSPLDEVIRKAEKADVTVERADVSIPETVPAENKVLRNEMLLHEIMRGSGFVSGKQRIFDFYNAHNSEPKFNKTFADFLKNEYGIGGHSGDDVILRQSHDSKGISLEYMENGTRRETNYTWNEVGKAISQLITEGKYMPEQALTENTRDNSAVWQEEPEQTEAAPEFREVPLYTMSFAEAEANDETYLYRTSAKENRDCAHALDNHIEKFYSDYSLDTDAVLNAIFAEFPEDRVEFVIAANIAGKNWDARYKRENIEWADNLMNLFSDDFRKESTRFHLTAHPGLIDLMGTAVHKYMVQLRESEKAENRTDETLSLREQLIKNVNAELAEFLANPGDASEYHINMEKDIADFISGIEDDELSDEQYETLLSRPHILAELYEEWLGVDMDEWEEDDMIDFISGTADSIAKNNEVSALERAKEHIREYLDTEFDSEETFKNLRSISIGYTELGDNNEYPFQAEADLVEYNINFYLDNQIFKTLHYDTLDEMNEFLDGLNFDDVVAYGNEELDDRNPDEVAKALDLYRNHITFCVISIEGEKPVVSSRTYVDREDITELDEYQDYILRTGKKFADVTVEYYDIGNDIDNESYAAEDGDVIYIQEHLNEVINHTGCIILETSHFSVETPDFLLEEYRQTEDERIEAERQALLPDGMEYINDDTAIDMWEQGIAVYNMNGEPLTPMAEGGKYPVMNEFSNIVDKYMADSEDVRTFRSSNSITPDISEAQTTADIEEISAEPDKIEWQPVPETADDNGRITSYSAKVDGTFYWISENPDHRYDIETSVNGAAQTIHNGADFATRADAEEYFEEYISELRENAGKADEIRIYQVKSGDEYREKRFVDLPLLPEEPNIDDYDLVYTGSLSALGTDDIDELYAIFNNNHPADFKGHSMSVGDVVMLHGTDIQYVDGVGFSKLPETFFDSREEAEKKKSVSVRDRVTEYINEVIRDNRGNVTLLDERFGIALDAEVSIEAEAEKRGITAAELPERVIDNIVVSAVENAIAELENEITQETEQPESGIRIVTPDVLGEVIETREPREKFMALDGERWVAVDNETGDAWTEDFATKEAAVLWLESGERTVEEISEVSIAPDNFGLDTNRFTYVFTEIEYETGEVFHHSGSIPEWNLNKTNGYEDIFNRYVNTASIDLEQSMNVTMRTYRFGSGNDMIPGKEDMKVIMEHLDEIKKRAGTPETKEFTTHFWKSVDSVLENLESHAEVKHRNNQEYGDNALENTFLLPDNFGSDNPDFRSAVLQIKLQDKEWLTAEEAVKELNRTRNSLGAVPDVRRIDMLNVRTIDSDGVVGEKDMPPELYYVFMQRSRNNPEQYRAALAALKGRTETSRPEQSEYRSKVQAIYEYENTHNIPEAERLTKWYAEENLSVAKASYIKYGTEVSISEKLIGERYNEISAETEKEVYTPRLGDKFKDMWGAEWEIVSLTGALPWYTDQCAIQNISGGFNITKNVNYAELLDKNLYTRVVDDTPAYSPKVGDKVDWDGEPFEVISIEGNNITIREADEPSPNEYTLKLEGMIKREIIPAELKGQGVSAEKAESVIDDSKSDYVPKIGDLIEIDDTLLKVADISGNIITFSEAESLFGNTSIMPLTDFFTKDFTVVEEKNEAETSTNEELDEDIEAHTEAEGIKWAYEYIIDEAQRQWNELIDEREGLPMSDYAYFIKDTAKYLAESLTESDVNPGLEQFVPFVRELERNGSIELLADKASRQWEAENGKSMTVSIETVERFTQLTRNIADAALDSMNRGEKAENRTKDVNIEIKSLAQLKRVLTVGAELEMTSAIRPEVQGQLRRVNYADTTGIYTIRPDAPDDKKTTLANGGRGSYLNWGKSSDWEFNGAVCTLYAKGAEHTEENKVISFTVTSLAHEQQRTADVPVEHQEENPFEVTPELAEELEGLFKSTMSPEAEEQLAKGLQELFDDTPAPKGQNFVISDENFGEFTPKARYRANVEAIKTLNAIEAENRTATPEEQQILSGYTGWGAIPQVFDSSNKDWSKEYAELIELLSDEEYSAARKSTMNAHYTSPTVINAVYAGLANLGFEKGKILEPAMGIGNFFGAMPENMRGSDLYGVELDSLTGRIAKQLYPEADIQIMGYEHTDFENDTFDAVVGNVPFGDYGVNDKDYNKYKFRIHDYFIAKSIDKVRPGGILAVVTSKGTMDKESSEMRTYIAQQAELLGAIRLPNNAFKANAGTEVTSDILFFQKRERPIEIDPGEVEWLEKAETPDGFAINNYFVQHPEMVLGKIVEGNKLYGNQAGDTSCEPLPGVDLKQQLADAVKNIKGHYSPASHTKAKKQEAADRVSAPPNSRKFSYYALNGMVYYRDEGSYMDKANIKGESLKRALAMIEIRDNVRELLDLQLHNADKSLDNAISVSRAKLNERYDAFVKQYGHFEDKKNTRILKGDDGYNLLTALEEKDDEGNYKKADIFNHDTVKPNTIVTHVDTAEEALILSIAEKAKVDFEYMTNLCGMDKEMLISELEGQIFRLPQEEEKYVTADEYLTGNIRTKLRALDYAPEGMDVSKHREALTAAIPKRVEAKDISVKLGAHWVSPEFITQFIDQKFNPGWRSHIEVQYSKASGRWKIVGAKDSDEKGYTATHEFGTRRRHAYDILEGILNHEDLTVKDNKLDEYGNEMRDSKGNYIKVTNPEETKAVQACVKRIEREWQDWVFKDPDRREALVDKYNEVFNSIRHREYDGSHLNFVGMNTDITLKEHQRNAVARALYGGNTMLAHAVGAGKSATRS